MSLFGRSTEPRLTVVYGLADNVEGQKHLVIGVAVIAGSFLLTSPTAIRGVGLH